MLRRPLDPLIRKAARDAGFDVESAAESGWHSFGISGSSGRIALAAPEPHVTLLAVPAHVLVGEAAEGVASVDAGSVGAPQDYPSVLAVPSPESLFHTLNRVRVLLLRTPEVLFSRVAARLAAVSETERTEEVTRRIGQDVFREALIEYWEGRCAVTGLTVPALLRASHTKPWRVADDRERLDVHNGLLLSVHLDALYDRGLLTFGENGDAILSADVDDEARAALGLAGRGLRLRWIAPGHRPYLAFHRERIFGSGEALSALGGRV
jgi:hypothetical protein